ncbi:hypothetical protein IGB42_00860 [Andreprevotia sp. IGB-42]|uniref:autotransporter domain-containing protein n=1 Tax=Andreprevotia sp. IGB-42 TaxID=2497473 RepID=UPI00135C3DAF|nr:autotransporter domain-containing protein [Andreprevotia sp. IGB-42]KAF0814805.1 hypothetical protein IGB42_00860 [Andreprevotia sp. IGB-42]
MKSFPLFLAVAALSPVAQAAPFSLPGINMQKQANAVLSLMSYSVVPDLTSSSVSISNGNTGNPEIGMTQFGGGFTISHDTPLYLEGAIAASRYDPTYLATDGQETRKLPVKWNTVSGTGGIGWDFPLTEDKELVIRPIVNFSLGYVASDLRLAQAFINYKADTDIEFLHHGTLKAYGYGGSLMLDYEHVRPEGEIDIELRYSDIRLESYGGTSTAVKGTADAQTANLYARYRAPTGLTALSRPVRYVLELSHSHYMGSQAGILGFDYLTSVGLGLELDSSAYDIFVTRTRLVLRHVFGNNVSGYSVGLAVSF